MWAPISGMRIEMQSETGDMMDSELTSTRGGIELRQDLIREAVNLAVNGEWERATEVNKAILELFPFDVEAMNRLAKALIELGSYLDARSVSNQVIEVAPYNNIAKKNMARIDHLTANPGAVNGGASRQANQANNVAQTFIEESGKSATTVIRNIRGNKNAVHVSPSDPVILEKERNSVTVKTLDGMLLGQVEPKIGNRLARLIDGGNKYSAAVLTVNEDGISIMIRETFKHRSLQNMLSFPTQSPSNMNGNGRVMLTEKMTRMVREEDEEDDDDDEEENLIDEDALETSWSEDE